VGTEDRLSEVYADYLRQFEKREYTKITCSGKYRAHPGMFSVLFTTAEIQNLHEEITKSMLAQWFSEQEDFRFLDSFDVYYVPIKTISLKEMLFSEMLHFFSPQNVINK
jgi:hypothetical protein